MNNVRMRLLKSMIHRNFYRIKFVRIIIQRSLKIKIKLKSRKVKKRNNHHNKKN